MSNVWGSFKAAAGKAGVATKIAGQKTKLNAEIALLDRNLKQRKQDFGVEMYDHISPLTTSEGFYTSDDKLTKTLQPPLVTAQREASALLSKRADIEGQIERVNEKRQNAFRSPAQTFGDKMKNAGKSASMAGSEAKLQTELAVCDTKLKYVKQQFGLELYGIFEEMEDKEGWLPTDRSMRGIYDRARADCEKFNVKKRNKQKELEALG
mmetsp:Transcript_45321/g.54977  ORF Transcript_45321/g.54977 Transcript_45321/m.54977 type:complete len:209 (+) Transcript_45321:101-727(+)|eukprot:CAMPEP_0172517600 /NCGR_PEP_ID=MMETSP1066-20121228/286385_1 /TAXON_ID=671091 /ORGANISM="Coscinodiscus wailesii, Strain CCMP2513" /LENGTH=208 /DNA_ID=CAMNT_0013299681 /DNA_START=87 /DNA_END=713 /DNA_ORIENTATION=-